MYFNFKQAEIQHLPNIVCYAIPKVPSDDLTMDDDNSDTIPPKIELVKLKPVPLAIPIHPPPINSDDDADTGASNSDIIEMDLVPSDDLLLPQQQNPSMVSIII